MAIKLDLFICNCIFAGAEHFYIKKHLGQPMSKVTG